jgi:CheY-like chemotaxis protein
MNILVVEDGEEKWAAVSQVLREALPEATQERARDLFEAEKALTRSLWDLLILDISLDIRMGGGRAGAAHDYVGGLKILGRMYYNEIDIPTIIVTGFDSFPSVRTNGDGVMLGLEDLEREAARQLAGNHIGTVRHGPEGWAEEFRTMLRLFAEGCG